MLGFLESPKRPKEIICRACGIYLSSNELINGNCPLCESDESLFANVEGEDDD